MKSVARLLILVLLVGCTKAIPTLEELASMNLVFEQSDISITSTTATITVKGTCDIRIMSVSMSPDDGATWDNPSTWAATSNFTCNSNGQFEYTFDLNDPTVAAIFNFTPGVAAVKAIKFKGNLQIGPTGESLLKVSYSPPQPNSPKGKTLVAGNSSGVEFLSSTSHKMKVRIGMGVSGGEMTSTNHKMKAGIKQ